MQTPGQKGLHINIYVLTYLTLFFSLFSHNFLLAIPSFIIPKPNGIYGKLYCPQSVANIGQRDKWDKAGVHTNIIYTYYYLYTRYYLRFLPEEIAY